jgi:tetratricopeptide (TPR) repeat protein
MSEALARAPERSALRCQALFTAGQFGYHLGLYREARRNLEESLAIAHEIGDAQRIASVLQPLGVACLAQGDLAAARLHLEEAVSRARQQEDPRKIAAALSCLAQLHRLEGDLDAAEPLYVHMLDLARGLEDRESVAIGLLNLAMTSVERGDANRARAMLAEALAIATQLGSAALGQNVLEGCAGLAGLMANGAMAARFYGSAEAQAARSGFHRDSADEAFLARWVARGRETSGEPEFARAESEGRALPLDAALDSARAWLAPDPA